MKQLYFLLLAIGFSVFASAQSEGASKIYGFRQKVLGGTIRVDPNGREAPPQSKYAYFIYLASTTAVAPEEIWINGQPYTPVVRRVSAPVEYTHPTSGNNRPKLLVPATNRKILQLSPSGEKIRDLAPKGKVLAAKNELVVIYKGGNKLYYKTLSKLNELEPVAMQ